jgi:tetratricopeptide (TPR) repeat protein
MAADLNELSAIPRNQIDAKIADYQTKLSAAPADPELNVALGWLLHFYKNQNEDAEKHFVAALAKRSDDLVALFALSNLYALRGDFKNGLEYALRVCRAAPDDPLAEIAAAFLRENVTQVSDLHEKIVSALQPLLRERTRLKNAEYVDQLLNALVRIGEDIEGQKIDLAALYSELGVLPHWLVVGPLGKFNNLSFDETYLPETEPALRKEYPGRRRPIKPVYVTAYDGSVAVPRYFERKGAYFAMTYVESPADLEAVFKVRSGTSLKIYLNDRLLHVKDYRLDFPSYEETFATALVKGWNKILVKLADSNSMVLPNFSLQIISPPKLHNQADSKGYSRAQAGRKPVVKNEMVAGSAYRYFKERASGNNSNPFALGMLAGIYYRRGNWELARRSMERALNLNPDYAPFQYQLGLIYNRLDNYPQPIAESKAKALFERAVQLYPSFTQAHHALALKAYAAGQNIEAIKALKKCIEIQPAGAQWHESLFGMYQALAWYTEAEESLQNALRLNPVNCSLDKTAFDYYQGRGALARLPMYERKLDSCHNRRDLILDAYLKTNRKTEALAELYKLKRKNPNNARRREQIVDILQALGRFAEAEKELEEWRALAPDDDGVLVRQGTLDLHKGDEASAKKSWQHALDMEPGNFEVRRALEFLNGKRFYESYRKSGLELVAKAPPLDKYPKASSYLLLDQGVQLINKDGSHAFLTHQVMRLLTKDGIQKKGEVLIPSAAEILELRTIKQDGTILEPEPASPNKRTISMPGLSEGDFIEFAYVDYNPSLDSIPDGFNNGLIFSFGSFDQPFEYSQYVVIAPKDLPIQIEQKNFDQTPKTQEMDGYIVREWLVTESELMQPEPNMVITAEVQPYVRISYNVTWEDISKFYQDFFLDRTKLTTELLETAQAQTKGLASVREKVQALYQFVNKNIKEGNQASMATDANEILVAKAGNRTTLLMALLKAAGISFDLVLSRPFIYKGLDLGSPNAGTFGFPLLRVQLPEGQKLWLDTASSDGAFDYIDAAVQGSDALVVGKTGAEIFTEVPKLKSKFDEVFNAIELTLDDSGGAVITTRHEIRGARAAALRKQVKQVPAANYNLFFQHMANQLVSGADLIEGSFENLENPESPLRINVKFKAAGYVSEEKFLPQGVNPLQLSRSLAQLPARNYPLLLGQPTVLRDEVVIHLPKGWTVRKTAEGLSEDNEFAKYRLETTVDQGTNRIKITREFYMPSAKIAPAAYPKLVEFCRKVDQAEKDKFELGRSGIGG